MTPSDKDVAAWMVSLGYEWGPNLEIWGAASEKTPKGFITPKQAEFFYQAMQQREQELYDRINALVKAMAGYRDWDAINKISGRTFGKEEV